MIMDQKVSIGVCVLLLFSCATQNRSENVKDQPLREFDKSFYKDYSSTILPIRMELLTTEQREMITELNNADTTTYFVESRPVFFQIVQTENNADQTRNSGPIFQSVPIFIYALGEIKNGKLVDYGWIEKWSGEKVWEMNLDSLNYAGGDRRNVKCMENIILSPGRYRLRYVSNNTHSHKTWQGDEPENDINYGITVFNTNGIKLVDRKIY